MTRIQQRRGTEAQWAAAAPVLAEGEIGIETDGDKALKVGDGATTFDALPDRLLPGGGTDGQVLTAGPAGARTWEDPSGAVDSVNGQTGVVSLNAAHVGADASGTAAGAVSGHAAQQGSGLHLPSGGAVGDVPVKGASGSTVSWAQLAAAGVSFAPTAENVATNVQDAIALAVSPVRVMVWNETTSQYEPASGPVRIWVGPQEPSTSAGPYADDYEDGDIVIDTETP